MSKKILEDLKHTRKGIRRQYEIQKDLSKDPSLTEEERLIAKGASKAFAKTIQLLNLTLSKYEDDE